MRNQTTVVRDFNGGLNIVDDDLNLNSSFQTLLDNTHRGIDSALTIRYGYTLFADFLDGDTEPVTSIAAFQTYVDEHLLVIYCTYPIFQAFDHITFHTPVPIPGAGITLQGTYGVAPTQFGANSFYIWHEVAATAAVSIVTPTAVNATRDNHMLAGKILEIAYFNDFIVVVDDNGEIARVDRNGEKLRIWSAHNAYAMSGDFPFVRPWSRIIYASSDIFKAELIVCNGFDKPLRIDFTQTRPVDYLSDGGNNINVPVCRYVRAVNKWLVMAGDPASPYRVHFSMTEAGGVWSGDAGAENDGVYLDIDNIASSSSSIIRGINRFREFCVVGFDDACVMVETGIMGDTGDGTIGHMPEVTDTIVRHGTIAHKTMVYMGFDLLMADAIGVPGLAKSLYDNTTMPSRHSDFIGPVLQRNIQRLTSYTLQNKCFAVFNSHDNRYILFLPDYDNDEIELTRNPVLRHGDLPQGRLLINTERHLLERGSIITLTGLVGLVGGADVTALNGIPFYVAGVVNDNWFSIDTGLTFTDIGSGGGTDVVLIRTFSETTGYAYTYNKSLKIKSWSRYRDLTFTAGCLTVYGRLFVSTDHRLWRMGTRAEPLYGDKMNGFEYRWRNSTLYNMYYLVLDEQENKTYQCIAQHISAADGTFEAARAGTDNEYWIPYYGTPIVFEFELPWADFDKRDKLKVLKQLGVDAKGTGRYTIQMFNDYYYKSHLDGTLTPAKEMEMIGGDSGGYGVDSVSYGSGRLAIRQRLWPWDMRGKLFKLRVQGYTNEHLSFVAFIMNYGLGGTTR